LELAAQGATLLEDLRKLTGEGLSDEHFALLLPPLLQAWFAFVPQGCAAPDLDIADLASAWEEVMTDLERPLKERGPSVEEVLFDHCRQPVLAKAIAGEMLNSQAQLPKKQRFSEDHQLTALIALRSTIDALDRALRPRA
jgi:hypothetical protein